MKELSAILARLLAPNAVEGSVLATLVTVEGSSYRRPGARLLVAPSGERIGSISGGCLEEDVLARARVVATSGQAELVVYDTTSENDLVWGVGLGCHGIVQVLLEKVPARPDWAIALAENLQAHRATELTVAFKSEPSAPGLAAPTRLGTQLANGSPAANDRAIVFRQTVAPPTSLIIFGAGDDAQPLASMADELGWRVTVADPRAAFATRERFPRADALVVARADELVNRVNPAPDALAVVMTHHYIHDLPLLCGLLPRPLAYLGLLGPRKRAEKILSEIEAGGTRVLPEWKARLHAPVGLDLGADAPQEVALAILAEMQAALAGRNARPLRERSGPIHE
jgi:xanthine/CO dehydrogenase XdhC/CoxF family maturation factor